MSYNRATEYLTVHEIAQLLRLSVLTIYKYIKGGQLIAVEFGGHYRVSRSALQAFIKEHRVAQRKEQL
ncbi:helix-turn-helix domain-containing protein [Candidatus Roizmanbacteria bacterium]|nr:helix-turn-helix domain-containing protein [Candidatus Roizmanbacteria bacterium]